MDRARAPAARDIAEVIVPGGEVRRRVAALAGEIAAAAGGGPLTMVAVMEGARTFARDLRRRLPMPVELREVDARSYRGASASPGPVELTWRAPGPPAGRDVLIVDDILDTGATLAAVVEAVRAGRPASLRTCVLLRKRRPGVRRAVAPDFVGFDIPDVFVVGYGLDFDGRFRDLPDIAALGRGGGSP